MIKFIKRFKDLALEGDHAKYYDSMTRVNRIEEIKVQAKEVSQYITEGDSILEIATGAGYLSIELAKLGNFQITAIDISKDLVEICIRNAMNAGADIDFQQGNVSNMSFNENSFNFIICVLAFKKFKEPIKALQEMHRVLKPGGSALIIDLNRQASMKETKKVAENMGLNGLKAYIAGAIQRCLAFSEEEFKTFIAQTKFKDHSMEKCNTGFYIFLRK